MFHRNSHVNIELLPDRNLGGMRFVRTMWGRLTPCGRLSRILVPAVWACSIYTIGSSSWTLLHSSHTRPTGIHHLRELELLDIWDKHEHHARTISLDDCLAASSGPKGR